jgi:ABC-type amino acid transport substrate-binding protein
MEFNYIYIVAPIETSYDELVECVQNGTYEVVMADLTITSSRTDKIDFSYPIYDNTIRLVIRKSQKLTISPFAFFKPFSYQLWLLIAFIIYFCSALLIAFYEFYGPGVVRVGEQSGDIHHNEKLISILRSLYHTIGALVQRGSELQPKTFFGCLQTVVVWLMSVILVALLTSNLTTYFNAQREKAWVQSIDDLEMCRKVPCNRIGIIERSQHEEYFTDEVMNGIQMNYYRLKHPNECYTKLLDYHIDVALADSSSADYYTQTSDYCQLEVAGIPFGKTYFGVALPKQWRYKQDLDKHIMQLKLNGEIDRLLTKWFQQKNCDRENGNENNDQAVGLTVLQISGLFYIFTSITSVNFIAFMLKWMHTVYKKQRSERNVISCIAVNDALTGETASANGQRRVSQLPVSNFLMPPSAYGNTSKLVENSLT